MQDVAAVDRQQRRDAAEQHREKVERNRAEHDLVRPDIAQPRRERSFRPSHRRRMSAAILAGSRITSTRGAAAPRAAAQITKILIPDEGEEQAAQRRSGDGRGLKHGRGQGHRARKRLFFDDFRQQRRIGRPGKGARGAQARKAPDKSARPAREKGRTANIASEAGGLARARRRPKFSAVEHGRRRGRSSAAAPAAAGIAPGRRGRGSGAAGRANRHASRWRRRASARRRRPPRAPSETRTNVPSGRPPGRRSCGLTSGHRDVSIQKSAAIIRRAKINVAALRAFSPGANTRIDGFAKISPSKSSGSPWPVQASRQRNFRRGRDHEREMRKILQLHPQAGCLSPDEKLRLRLRASRKHRASSNRSGVSASSRALRGIGARFRGQNSPPGAMTGMFADFPRPRNRRRCGPVAPGSGQRKPGCRPQA